MLTSPARNAEDYRSAAGDVRLQLSDVKLNGAPAEPPELAEVASVRSILRLLQIGGRYAVSPSGQLETGGSSPETLDLADRLKRLVPGKLARVQTGGETDMAKWSELAGQALSAVENGQRWEDFGAKNQEFIEVELEPFLANLLDQTAEEPEE